MYHTIWRKQKPIKKVKNKTVNAGSITRVEDKNTSIILLEVHWMQRYYGK